MEVLAGRSRSFLPGKIFPGPEEFSHRPGPNRLRGGFPMFRTGASVFGAQVSGFGGGVAVLETRFSVFSGGFSVLGSRFSVFSVGFSVFGGQFSGFSSRFSGCKPAAEHAFGGAEQVRPATGHVLRDMSDFRTVYRLVRQRPGLRRQVGPVLRSSTAEGGRDGAFWSGRVCLNVPDPSARAKAVSRRTCHRSPKPRGGGVRTPSPTHKPHKPASPQFLASALLPFWTRHEIAANAGRLFQPAGNEMN